MKRSLLFWFIYPISNIQCLSSYVKSHTGGLWGQTKHNYQNLRTWLQGVCNGIVFNGMPRGRFQGNILHKITLDADMELGYNWSLVCSVPGCWKPKDGYILQASLARMYVRGALAGPRFGHTEPNSHEL